MKKIILAIMLVFAINTQSFAEDFEAVQFVKNYDGDTLTVNIPWLMSDVFGKDLPVRVSGIDTPEMKGKCEEEKMLAKCAKVVVKNMLETAKQVDLRNCIRDKYFRLNCDVYADNVSISTILLGNKMAVPYDGGTKAKVWCK